MSERQLTLGGGPPGWRLHRLEMANWGTFGGARVHQLCPDGGWTLLVGENGSGKSTAIDALRTLLAPRAQLRGSFNDAAGGQGRRDRTLTSYIRGQWSASRDDEGTKAQYLRDEDVPTQLMAVFRNGATGGCLTLAQILWVSGGTDQTVYLVAPGVRSVVPDLQDLGGGREMRRVLRDRGFSVYDSYAGYARDFHQRMGIPGEGAMEVFNQAIGIKEVVSVKHFLRGHLLAPGTTPEMIRDRVIPQFASLEDCWNSIQRDKQRLQLLEPVVAAHEAEQAASALKRQLDAWLVLVPNHYGLRHRELLARALAATTAELQALGAKLTETENETAQAEARAVHCQRALDGHGDSARIGELANEITACSLRLQSVRQTRNSFDQAVKACALGLEVIDEAGFLRVKLAAEARRHELTTRRDADTEAEQQAGLQHREATNRLRDTTIHLEELRRRRVLIDLELQHIRDWICDEEGLAKEELPFAGELVEVKPERDDWQGAIERLLHGFGVSLLVPERRYRTVATLINRTRLRDANNKGLRLQFHRVPETVPESPPPPDENTVAGCLNHRDDHPFSRWVRGEIARQFHHRCCRDVTEMEGVKFGLTREGLIRGGTRHVKDDRRGVNDRTHWVLGWSPEKKIQALAEEKARWEREVATCHAAVARLRAEVEELRQKLLLLDGVLALQAFSEVDLTGGLQRLEDLKHEKEALERRSADRLQLEQALAQARERVRRLRDRERVLVGEKSLLEASVASKRDLKKRLDAELPADPELPDAEGLAYLAEIERGQEGTLDTIVELERRAVDTLRNRSSQQQRIVNEARTRMGAPMQAFLQAFPEDAKDLSPNPDYAEDFVRIHTRVRHDDLPVHEERFRAFLNDNLTQNIASLDAGLAQEVKAHRQRIAQVNRTLRQLEYSPDSYVEIDVRERGEQAVAGFKKRLRDILGMGMQDDEAARLGLFERIKELIEELKKPDFAKVVADSRNWLDFGIRECRRGDGSEVDYFDSSQGKSGGQKAKLAFTILAASLCAQYGLAADADSTDGFRLVVIDEIFARTDEGNSRRALELFRSMGFQLLLAAPWEAKVRIAEPYVDNYHLTVNPEHHASTIRGASREAYAAAAATSA
ncbi:MAG: ATP-binding protein [Verrucomicrobiales bacterium]